MKANRLLRPFVIGTFIAAVLMSVLTEDGWRVFLPVGVSWLVAHRACRIVAGWR